ncbi:MAG: hypothetical protein MUC99_10000 [Anaerolineae bacterium]|jgi:hypothetical protein|nr:hypothetical protein [Anaerolineae bacterium]
MFQLDSQSETTRTQRFSHYFAIAYCVIAFFIGANLRDSTLFAATVYQDTEVGITAYYPTNWLFSTRDGSVLTVEDTRRLAFKTTIQIRIVPFSPGMSVRNIIDTLSIERQISRPFYKVLSIGQRPIRATETATTLDYTYVATVDDPFLQIVPSVVQGEDVIIIRRNQAILISFMTDADTYTQDYPVFERFISSLEY